ncbi:hypothetical protein CW749_03400 [Vibrio sp. vnigr-6D03]|uniref:hypothetical protein n=1 Tax=Vibrio sp. vnigr-6D03 TaxID=2058088 RepID=UPI000C342E56|nr:hypothetical protein [Vibrio sp. vnigr-6D03]PKF80833.1 hypothetical protein CW749_03400 [Vibrio sp. vnigr-6D03]
MKTQDITAELEVAIQSLADQGKEPTVALVKTRMKTPAPMPAIIAAIKSWKSSSHIPKVEVGVSEPSSNERVALLEAQIAAFSKQIEDLNKRIEKLENQSS